MLRAHCPALGRCFSSIWRRCCFWGYSYLVLRGQTQIQCSQGSFSYYTYLEYHIVLIISLVFLRRTWNSWLLWAISYSVLLIHFPFPFRVQGNLWRSNFLYSGAKTDLFCVYFFLPLCQQWSHEQIITLQKSISPQMRLTNVWIEVNLMKDSPHSTSLFSRHMLYTHSWLAIFHR